MISCKVSIIVPFYNTEAYIGTCLRSLTRQTHSDIEIICINDGSTDNSRSIVESFQKDNEHIYLTNLERSGIGVARKYGLEQASGKYVMFCDSDDFYESVMVSSMVGLITKAVDIDLAMCNCRVRNMNGTERKDKNYLISKKNGTCELTQSLKREVNIVLWNKIYKTDLLKKYNINFIDIKCHEDENFIFKYLSVSSKINFINKKFYTYLYRDGSLSEETFRNPDHIKEYLHCVEDFIDFLDKHSLWWKNNQYCAEAIIYGSHLINGKVLNRETKEKSIEKIRYLSQKIDTHKINDEDIKRHVLTIQRGHVENRKYNLLPHIQKTGKIIPIIFSCDDNYIKYLSVTLCSIIEHASPIYLYHIIIIDCGIKENSIAPIERQLARCKNFTLHIISAMPFLKEHKKYFKIKDHFTAAIYGRLLIPEVCRNFDKVIYADTDMIFGRDIAELMKINLQDNFIAAAIDSQIEINRRKDPWLMRYFEKKLSLNIDNIYINSGLIIFNLKKWRELSIQDKCIRLLEISKEFVFPDQDVINVICKNKIHYLDQSWNCACPVKSILNDPPIVRTVTNSVFLEDLIFQYNSAYNAQDTVFHYTSSCKPWNIPDIEKAEKWWFYCRKTDLYEKILFNPLIQIYLMDKKHNFIENSLLSIFSMKSGEVKNRNNSNKMLIKYYFIFLFPILKTKITIESKKYYIFGFRVAKVIREHSKIKYYILGIKIFTIELQRI